MTKKYEIRYPAPGKKKQIFKVKASSPLDAWKIGNGKYLVFHGSKNYQNIHFPSIREIKENEYKGVAHTIRDVLETGFGDKKPELIDLVYEPEDDFLEEEYIEEVRRGPTKALTREKQRLGALRAKRMKSLSGPKMPRKRRPLEEVVRSDIPPDKAVTKYDPVKRVFRVIARNGRRKIIDTKNSNPKIPRKNKGYQPYVFWDGTTYNN